MASPPPNQDQVLAPDRTHQQHIVRVKQSLADLIERGVRGEDFYVNAEGLLAARETEEDEDIIEELHFQTHTPAGYKPLPWKRREIQDPDLRYINGAALASLATFLGSVEHLVRKPILIEKLATMLAQPRGIIRRDLKKLFRAHLILPLSCWYVMETATEFESAIAGEFKGRFIWKNVIGPAKILLGVTKTVRSLPPIKGYRWRLPILQALTELHEATRPADPSLQNALNMLDEACPASALTNGLSEHQDTLLWRKAHPQLLGSPHIDWPIRLVDFADEYLGMNTDSFQDAYDAEDEDIVGIPYQYDVEADPDDLSHQLASWTGDD